MSPFLIQVGVFIGGLIAIGIGAIIVAIIWKVFSFILHIHA